MLWHYIEVLENTVLFPLKKVSKSSHKYERINILEFTRMDQDKFTSLKFPSVFIIMADGF